MYAVEWNGKRFNATKEQLFSAALKGQITPKTRCWVSGQEFTCGQVPGIVFGPAGSQPAPRTTPAANAVPVPTQASEPVAKPKKMKKKKSGEPENSRVGLICVIGFMVIATVGLVAGGYVLVTNKAQAAKEAKYNLEQEQIAAERQSILDADTRVEAKKKLNLDVIRGKDAIMVDPPEALAKGGSLTDDEKKLFVWDLAIERLKKELKAPSTAKFETDKSKQLSSVSSYSDGSSFAITSFVDAENSYGANIRSDVFVTMDAEWNRAYVRIDFKTVSIR